MKYCLVRKATILNFYLDITKTYANGNLSLSKLNQNGITFFYIFWCLFVTPSKKNHDTDDT